MPSSITDIDEVDDVGEVGWGGTTVGAVCGDWADVEDASGEDLKESLNASNSACKAAKSALS